MFFFKIQQASALGRLWYCGRNSQGGPDVYDMISALKFSVLVELSFGSKKENLKLYKYVVSLSGKSFRNIVIGSRDNLGATGIYFRIQFS